MDYKNTLLLPKTDFPMRAELPKREPALLAKWRDEKIYDQIIAARKDAAADSKTTFILADGPPFANGDAHMGHALNMVLKDIVLKYHNMCGHYTPFVPGWDCHGLPIEHKVMKELGAAETDPIKIREKCEATAGHWAAVQSEQFQRLGVFGDWANPYMTLDPAYEAETLRVFATLVGKNLVYQGLRPVLWSTGCQTALAEAEIEYQEKVDPAIYVKFPLVDKFRKVSFLIWTTTPWTLPANLAVAIAPNLDYGTYEIGGERYIFHTGLLNQIPGAGDAKLIDGPHKGSVFVGLQYLHPFLNDGRARQVYTGDFVTADAGTGLVHIAPGHGQDDYQLGQVNGLPVIAPVDDRGCLTAEFLPPNADDDVKALVGQYVFKASAAIIEILNRRHLLYAHVEYKHDYPYCWRSKTPIVYRAVKQWFIKVDAFRAEALAKIDTDVQWIPENGRNRIRGAVESRPDWCISRQRTWGIPLPVFYGEGGQALLSEEVVRAFATLVETGGSGLWFAKTADELAVAITAELARTGSKVRVPLGLRKGKDTLDVWIDSGTSWAAVVGKRPEFKAPDGTARKADLYLEGSDQHRGWFQSSLLTSIAATGEAPYKAVLTNGFVVDMQRKKLSKSNEGYSKPVDLMSLVNEHGADVLRLWVASQDYQDDIPFSPDILARVSDAYRSIRNTLRILLGNLSDFDVERDAVTPEKWTELDRYAFAKFKKLVRDVTASYEEYRFSQVYQIINQFAVDLSAFYIDVLKDRMYCDARASVTRRSAQTVLNHILLGLSQLLAPVTPFTVEEAWGFAKKPDSIHRSILPKGMAADTAATKFNSGQWDAILLLRSRVNEKLEEARRDKKIGKSLEAHVAIETPLGSRRAPRDESARGPAPATLENLPPADLEELFIVSKVVITPTDGEETITVTRAEDHGMKKCVRCWKYWDHVGSDAEHPELCERCTKVVLNLGA